MIDFINRMDYKKWAVRQSKGTLKGLAVASLLASAGLHATNAAAATCYAESILTLQSCLNAAAADEENWLEIQLKEQTYYLDNALTLTGGKVRLVGAGRVKDSDGAYQSAAVTEHASDRKALDRAKFYVLDGQNQKRIFSVSGDTTKLYIQGVTFRNGKPHDDEGGGALLFNGSTLGIAHSVFHGNSDSAVVIAGNTAEHILNSYFYNNTADVAGCDVEGATSKYWAGAISAIGGEFAVKRSTFESNSGCRGGAIWAGAAEMDISHSTFSNNTANLGGAVYISNGNGESSFANSNGAGFIGTTIYENHATVAGGGLYFEPISSTWWDFHGNILAKNTVSAPANNKFSDCYSEGFSDFISFARVEQNILGRIGEGEMDSQNARGDCSFWLIAKPEHMPAANVTSGGFTDSTGTVLIDNPGTTIMINGSWSEVLDPQLESLSDNGGIGLQMPTHLPEANSIAANLYDTAPDGPYDTCFDQRYGQVARAVLPDSKCAAGATQRILQENGTLGLGASTSLNSSYYKLVVPENQVIQIDLTSEESDNYLTLLSANKGFIEGGNSDNGNARIVKHLNAGIYYIRATGLSHSSSSDLRDYFLSVNAGVELTPSLVLIDYAEIAGNRTLGQTGSGFWERISSPSPPGTSGDYFYSVDSSNGAAIFESDFFDPAEAKIYFKYFLDGASSGSLFLDIEINGIWELDYIIRTSSNSNHISPHWQYTGYDFSSLAEQGHDRIRIRLYAYKPLGSSHSLLLDNILITRQ